MKTCFKISKKSLLAGALIFIAALFLTSCENFLKGASIRKDLEEAIAIANTNPVTIYVEAEEGSGTVTPTQLRLKKKETFELRYKMNDSWRFIKWEVRDRYTKEPVPDAITFYDETAFETKATLIDPKEGQGLEIYAKAVLLPAIISYTPEIGSINNAYTPIKVTFNIPVDDSDVTGKESVFTYKNNNITIVSRGEDITDKFETPYFNDDKTVLTIMPRAKDLSSYMFDNNIDILDVSVTFSDQIIISRGDEEILLTQNKNNSFVVNYTQTLESGKPELNSFFASRLLITPENADSFTEDSKFKLIQDPNDFHLRKADILNNRTTGLVYIYGSYSDSGSGVRSVTITEVLTDRIENNEYNAATPQVRTVYDDIPKPPVVYNRENAIFIQKGNTTEFFIEHEVTKDSGAVELTIDVSDACGNTTSQKFFVYKVTSVNYFNIQPYNFYTPNSNYFDEQPFDENIFNTSLKKIRIPYGSESGDFQEYIYKAEWEEYNYDNAVTVDYSLLDFKCIYNGKTVNFSFVNNEDGVLDKQDYWECNLDVESVWGLHITITITDDIGNKFSRDYCFPKSEPSVVVEGSKANIYFDDVSVDYLIVDVKGNTWKMQSDLSYNLEFGTIYKIIPVSSIGSYNRFCGPVSSYTFSTDSSSQNLDYKVALKNEPYLELLPNKCNIVINLADDSWNKFDKIIIDSESLLDFSWYLQRNVPYGTFEHRCEIESVNAVNLYKKDIKMKIYGIKNNRISEVLEKTIATKHTADGKPDGTYDVYPPGSDLIRNDLYDLQLKLWDNDSGPDKVFIVKEDGTKKQLFENEVLEHNKIKHIPVYELEAACASSTGTCLLEITDKKGNVQTIGYSRINIDCEEYSPPRLNYQSSNSWKFGGDIIDWYYSNVMYKSFLTTNNGISSWTDPVLLPDLGSSTKFGPYDISDNSFVKISTAKLFGTTAGTGGFGYYYTSTTNKSSGSYDYMQKLSDSVWLVSSDAPTFVHTLKTNIPYNKCRNWTADEWETFNKSIGDVQYNFSSENSSPKRYNVPLNKIEKGECYVILAYFAACDVFVNNPGASGPKRLIPFMTEVMVKQ